MTTYKALKGKKIKFLASDPPAAVAEGQVWYNGVDYKTSVSVIGWSSGGNLNTGRTQNARHNIGTQTATLCSSGNKGGSPYATTNSEEYNGSSWTEGNNVNTTRRLLGGAGTQTAAVVYGGYGSDNNQTASEEYNGTSYSEGNEINTGRYIEGTGTQTAVIAAGGFVGNSGTIIANSEEYNGTSWSEGNNLNAARHNIGHLGTQTAGLAFGGVVDGDPNFIANVEEYNGTSWSEVNNMPSAQGYMAGFGTQLAGVAQAGTAVTLYDGTNWAAGASNTVNKTERTGGGTAASGILFGGASSSNATEEYTNAILVKTITDS
jgi:hypothetical protein